MVAPGSREPAERPVDALADDLVGDDGEHARQQHGRDRHQPDVEQLEPVAWAEELIETAEAAGHHRLAQLYVTAAQCYLAGRLDAFIRYADAAGEAIDSGRFDEIPYEFRSEEHTS